MSDYNETLADALAERAKQDPKVAEIARRARVFDEMQGDPHWQELRAEVARKEARWMEGYTKRLLAGQPVDQREIDFKRGYFAGAAWAASIPEQAMKSLEEAATKAWLFGLKELEEEGGETY